MSDDQVEQIAQTAERLASIAGWFKGVIVFFVVVSFAAGAWATKVYVLIENATEELKTMQADREKKLTEWTVWRTGVDKELVTHDRDIAAHERRINNLEQPAAPRK